MKGIIINFFLWTVFIITVVVLDMSNGESVSHDVAFWGGVVVMNIWCSKLYDNKEK